MKTLTVGAAANNDVVSIVLPTYACNGLPKYSQKDVYAVIRNYKEEKIEGMRLTRYVASESTIGMYFSRYSGNEFDKMVAIKNLLNQVEEKYRPYARTALITALVAPQQADPDPFADDPTYTFDLSFDLPEEF